MRLAERLFNFPRLYRAKYAITGSLLAAVRPLAFRSMVTAGDLFAQVPAGARVCEIGCGDGANYRALREVGPLSYTGIDANPAMVAHCRDEYPEHAWLRAFPPYSFPDRAFDVCIIVNVLHHLDNREQILEMLREAGRIASAVLLFEPLQSESRVLRALKRTYWSLTDGGLHYNRLDEFQALFAEAGLSVAWERYTLPLRHFYAARLVLPTGPADGVKTVNE
jgi:SAM-dependent methyltransferase